MALGNFINIPASATVGGAPIDAFQGDAFRQNDLLFEGLIRSLAHNLFALNNGADGTLTYNSGPQPDAKKLWRVNNASIGTNWDLSRGFPLVILATGTINLTGGTLSGNAAGVEGGKGHLGGAGGGGTLAVTGAGRSTVLPIGEGTVALGGAIGANNGASPADNTHVLRALPFLSVAAGGAAGGDASAAILGGRGGGVVVLVADTITLGTGKIFLSGGAGGAGAGGGGGGAIILMAKTFTTVPALNADLVVNGGNGGAGAGAGGAGILFTATLP